MTGCQGPGFRGPDRSAPAAPAARPEDLALSPERADMAAALAHFSLGILREGLADGSALESYRQTLELKPDYDALYLRMAILHIKEGQPDQAVALMQDACRRNPRSADAHLHLAQIYQALRQPAEAIKAAQRAIRIDPANAKGYIQLAYLYLAAQDEDRARATLEDARKTAGDKLPVLRFLGDLYAQKIVDTQAPPGPHAARAIACYEEAAKLPPDAATPLYQERLADLYLMNRQPAKALQTFQKLAARSPGSLQLQKKLAVCYIALGRNEEAVEALKAALGQEPPNAQLLFYLGELYESMGNTNKAIASFRSAVDTAPAISAPYLKLASYYIPGEPEKAGRILQSGLERFPEDKDLLEMLAEFYVLNQQPLEALGIFVRLQNLLLRKNEPLPAARHYLDFGNIALQHQLDDLAGDLYETGLEQDPGLLEARVRLAFVHLIARKNPDEALNVIGAAVCLRPEDPAAWYYFGLLHSQAGIYPSAIGAFERAAALAGRLPNSGLLQNTAFYFNYGAACERAGRFEQAEDLLRQAVRLDTDNAEAFNYLAYMWAEKGVQLDLAYEYSLHSLDCEPDNGAFMDTLGWILYRQQRLAEALECLQSAIYFMPDDPTILEHLGDVWLALGAKAKALAWWQRSYRIKADNKTIEEKLRKHGAGTDVPRPNAPAP